MKYSYKLILILCIIGLLSGCEIEEDDTPAGAIDQLSITGRIIDHNNQPVKNIPVVFYFFRSGYIESLNRKKATSMTDENKKGIETYYYLYPDIDGKKYFKIAKYFYDIDAFWTEKYHILSDYILWEGQYVKVIAKTKPKDAKRYEIECELERPLDYLGKYLYSYEMDIKVPLHQDLKFTMKWDGKCNRTVFVKKDNLPEQIDLSYIPE